jgi:twitching motility protein PilT
MDIRKILEEMITRGASDLHVKVGSPPMLRIDGSLVHMDLEPPGAQQVRDMAVQLMTDEQREEFEATREADFAFGLQGLARFRANIYQQRNTVAIVLRTVPLEIPRFEQCNLPGVLRSLCKLERGLILVTGTVGSGKSTTLAAMIDLINRTEARNIITIEDPVEFLHLDSKSMVSQREVGLDTESYMGGLKYILRQDPDVILLGEIRDVETMRVAMMAADTGHLVLSSLHTTDAPQTVNRILSFFPPHQHGEIRFTLASTLGAVVSQRLVPKADASGRVPAVEVMINTETVKEMILDPEKTLMLSQAITDGHNTYGMQTFDQSLMGHYTRNLITREQALRFATSSTEFELRLQGIASSSDSSWDSFELDEEESAAANAGAGDEKVPDEPDGIERF